MRANFKSQYLLVSERNALFKLLNGESYRGETHLKMALQEPLSSLQPEFKQEGVGTFTNCLLLHRLLITGQVPEYFIFLSYLILSHHHRGQEEEVLRRKQELSHSLLSHTCECTFHDSKVRY